METEATDTRTAAATDHIVEGLRSLAVPIDTLNLDAANVRTHDARNLEAIKASLNRFGQRAPLVVQRQGMVVRAGNARLIAAREMGWTTVAALVVDESDVEAASYAIADNRTAELAEWDVQALETMMATFPEDLAGIAGFTADELEELTKRYQVDAARLPDLSSEAGPIQTMTFTLHDDQAEIVKEAIAASKEMGPFPDTGNENENGNALARVAEVFLGAR